MGRAWLGTGDPYMFTGGWGNRFLQLMRRLLPTGWPQHIQLVRLMSLSCSKGLGSVLNIDLAVLLDAPDVWFD